MAEADAVGVTAGGAAETNQAAEHVVEPVTVGGAAETSQAAEPVVEPVTAGGAAETSEQAEPVVEGVAAGGAAQTSQALGCSGLGFGIRQGNGGELRSPRPLNPPESP